ncbi:C45 family peptidase [Brevibacterium sp. HMSC07C04]|uniref:C45 family autoproteolytic acyltransferase/hydolase n=1 Tax=Brevibacterium sp. HMSC07C04 TaxID=1581130 RepID=UPI0008A14CD3|nr:C45 family peptidase [Brevibacterium sp. HMSC07C04]OFS25323.1 hypothetical protein HMPREF3162_08885 [Brevibacterium sp. HMSC07C04]
MPVPHEVRSESIVVSGPTPQMRGMARATQTAQRIRSAHRSYTHLFQTLGIEDSAVKAAAQDSLAALRDWDPDQHQEVTGAAMGAGLTPADLMVIIARTEIMTLADRSALPSQLDRPRKESSTSAPSECSTITFAADRAAGAADPAAGAGAGAPCVGAQTWDWYPEFADLWHLHSVAALPGGYGYAGLAEYGMTGKIGVNSAGLGCFLNILFSTDDAPGGVPVHSVLARILGVAGSVDEAVRMIEDAPLSSSSVITLIDSEQSAMVEISAGRTRVLDQRGYAVHTNHFLDGEFAQTGLLSPPNANTFDRLEFLQDAVSCAGVPQCAEDLVPLLCSDLASGCVAKLPKPGGTLETATLASVRIDPAQRKIAVSPGVPQYVKMRTVVLQAP